MRLNPNNLESLTKNRGGSVSLAPMSLPRRTRPPRVERPSEVVEISDETSYLWAVSYADFLMVLLSFFIIFFSLEGQQKKAVLDRIKIFDSSAVTGKPGGKLTIGRGTVFGGGGGGGGGLRGPAGTAAARAAFPLITTLEGLFGGMNVQAKPEVDRLLLLFPDNLFKSGRVQLDNFQKNEVEKILLKLKPYAEEIHLTFIGHADSTPVKTNDRAILQDNFDLSSLRATRALQFAIQLGFSASQVAAMGSAQNERDNRTLSLLIRAKGDVP